MNRSTHRFTFSAEQFADFDLLGPDEFFGLIVPTTDRPMPQLTGNEDELMTLLRSPDADNPVALRWYTIRRLRRELSEIDVDIVLHGATGPASRWALTARPGDRVGFREGSAPYIAPVVGSELLVADETALPALAAILETRSEWPSTRVLVEVPGPLDELLLPADCAVEWLHRGDDPPGSKVVPRIKNLAEELAPALEYAWLCGEREIATGSRRALAKAGMETDRIMFSGYWRLGTARL